MPVLQARKYNPKLPLEKQLEASMTPEQMKRWNTPEEQKKRTPHARGGCMATEAFREVDAQLKSGELGPGSQWACDECGALKMVVHLALKNETEVIDAEGKRKLVELLPLGWRNVSLGTH